jgi:hypothetical protein
MGCPKGQVRRALAERRLAGLLDHPEVEHPHAVDPPGAVLGDHHVVGLEVAVDQPRRVGRRQPAAGLHEHRHDLVPRPTSAPQPALERHAGDELHGDEHLVAERPDLVHRHHVRVGQPRHRLGLAQQAGLTEGAAAGGVRHPRPQQLDRHLSIQLRVVGGAHQAHPARAEGVHHGESPDTSREVRRLHGVRTGTAPERLRVTHVNPCHGRSG